MMLNTLIGNLNWKGGTLVSGGWFPDNKGRAYDLASFPGAVRPKGLPLGRNVPYEKASEFKVAEAAGTPYPAKGPWYPNAPGPGTEWFSSMVTGYPYGLEALILRNANPVYGIPGIEHVIAKLKDPMVVPLVISIDPFINERTALADYIVPGTVMYESRGFAKPWNGGPTKVTTARWPVMEPNGSDPPPRKAPRSTWPRRRPWADARTQTAAEMIREEGERSGRLPARCGANRGGDLRLTFG